MKFCTDLCADAFLSEFAHFQFFLNKNLGFKNFENVFADLNSLGKGLLKMYNSLQFAQFFLAQYLLNN